MTIIRRRHSRDFTTIKNDVFRDESLSLDALGLLCYLRSRPDDWHISQEHLRRRFGSGAGDARKAMGREQMQRIMRELIASGWVQREAARTGRGAFGGVEYVVLDEPVRTPPAEDETPPVATLPQSGFPTAAPESGSPTPGEPATAEPEAGDPEAANPTPYQELDSTKGVSPLYPPASGGTRPSEDRISEREALAGRRPERGPERRPRPARGCRGAAPPAVPPDTAARFERLWAAYPESGRLPADRAWAVALFAALPPADQEAAIGAAAAEARTRAEHRSQARALHRWLERGLWRNGAPARPAASAGGPARVFVAEDTPEWRAWQDHERQAGRRPRSHGIHSTVNRASGWWFPSRWPPTSEAAG